MTPEQRRQQLVALGLPPEEVERLMRPAQMMRADYMIGQNRPASPAPNSLEHIADSLGTIAGTPAVQTIADGFGQGSGRTELFPDGPSGLTRDAGEFAEATLMMPQNLWRGYQDYIGKPFANTASSVLSGLASAGGSALAQAQEYATGQPRQERASVQSGTAPLSLEGLFEGQPFGSAQAAEPATPGPSLSPAPPTSRTSRTPRTPRPLRTSRPADVEGQQTRSEALARLAEYLDRDEGVDLGRLTALVGELAPEQLTDDDRRQIRQASILTAIGEAANRIGSDTPVGTTLLQIGLAAVGGMGQARAAIEQREDRIAEQQRDYVSSKLRVEEFRLGREADAEEQELRAISELAGIEQSNRSAELDARRLAQDARALDVRENLGYAELGMREREFDAELGMHERELAQRQAIHEREFAQRQAIAEQELARERAALEIQGPDMVASRFGVATAARDLTDRLAVSRQRLEEAPREFASVAATALTRFSTLSGVLSADEMRGLIPTQVRNDAANLAREYKAQQIDSKVAEQQALEEAMELHVQTMEEEELRQWLLRMQYALEVASNS